MALRWGWRGGRRRGPRARRGELGRTRPGRRRRRRGRPFLPTSHDGDDHESDEEDPNSGHDGASGCDVLSVDARVLVGPIRLLTIVAAREAAVDLALLGEGGHHEAGSHEYHPHEEQDRPYHAEDCGRGGHRSRMSSL